MSNELSNHLEEAYSDPTERDALPKNRENRSIFRIKRGLRLGGALLAGGAAVLAADKPANAELMGGGNPVKGVAYCHVDPDPGFSELSKQVLGSPEDMVLPLPETEEDFEKPVNLGQPFYWQGKVFIQATNYYTEAFSFNIYDAQNLQEKIGAIEMPNFDGANDHIQYITDEGLMMTTEGMYLLKEDPNGEFSAEYRGDIASSGDKVSYRGVTFIKHHVGLADDQLLAIKDETLLNNDPAKTALPSEYQLPVESYLSVQEGFNGGALGADDRAKELVVCTKGGYVAVSIPPEAIDSVTGKITDYSWLHPDNAKISILKDLGAAMEMVEITPQGLRYFRPLYQGYSGKALVIEYLGTSIDVPIDSVESPILDIQILPNNQLLITWTAEDMQPSILTVKITETYPAASTSSEGAGEEESTAVAPQITLAYTIEDADLPGKDLEKCSTIQTPAETCAAMICETNNECTYGVCMDDLLACVEIPEEDGVECDDDNSSTFDDQCVDGYCMGTPEDPEPESEPVAEASEAEYLEVLSEAADKEIVEETAYPEETVGETGSEAADKEIVEEIAYPDETVGETIPDGGDSGGDSETETAGEPKPETTTPDETAGEPDGGETTTPDETAGETTLPDETAGETTPEKNPTEVAAEVPDENTKPEEHLTPYPADTSGGADTYTPEADDSGSASSGCAYVSSGPQDPIGKKLGETALLLLGAVAVAALRRQTQKEAGEITG